MPEDIKAMFDAVSRTQVHAKVIPSQTAEVSFKDTPQQMLNALGPNRVIPIHRHRNSSATVTVLFKSWVFNEKWCFFVGFYILIFIFAINLEIQMDGCFMGNIFSFVIF